MTRLSASVRSAMSTCKFPTCNQGTAEERSGPEWLHVPNRIRLATNERTAAVIDNCALSRGSRIVNNVITVAAENGSSNTSHAMSAAPISVFHQGQIFDVRRLPFPIERDDQGQPNRNFGGGNGYD